MYITHRRPFLDVMREPVCLQHPQRRVWQLWMLSVIWLVDRLMWIMGEATLTKMSTTYTLTDHKTRCITILLYCHKSAKEKKNLCTWVTRVCTRNGCTSTGRSWADWWWEPPQLGCLGADTALCESWQAQPANRKNTLKEYLITP